MSVPSHFGRYRVLQPLATGEMGVVYLAEDPLIGRKVAIKGIRLSRQTDDAEIRGLYARFEQEIQIAGTFSHPNIVMLFDVGEEDGYPFIAMEYVDGRNLRAELQATGPLTVNKAVDLIVPVSRALEYAHHREVIHRDIKPTNILVSSEGVPKITDFGVARLYGSTLTRAGKIFGTPAYMSPEQTIGGTIDGASDQFAVATVAYELLTGERPFKGPSPTAVIYEVIEHHPTSPDEINPLIPAAVAKVIMRGLEKNPKERYESCDEFADALERAAEWSRAHPELAYLGDQAEMEAHLAPSPPPSRDATSSGWTLAVRTRAAALFEVAAATSAADHARAAWQKMPDRFRSAPTVLGAALMFTMLLLFVAWALPDGAAEDFTQVSTGSEAATVADGAAARPVRARPAPNPDAGVAYRAGNAPATDPARGGPSDAAAFDPADVEGADEARGSASEAVVFAVTTQPRGARVEFDGEDLGSAASVPVSVRPGQRHLIRLELEGYEPFAWAFALDNLSEANRSSGALHFPLTPIADDAASTDPAESPAVVQGEAAAGQPASDRGAAETAGGGEGSVDNSIPPTPTEIRRLRAPQQTTAPQKLNHVEPDVPETERGVVVLEIEVSSRGNVVQAKLLRGLSRTANQAALDAVVRWKYEPKIVDGQPVNVIMTITLPINGG